MSKKVSIPSDIYNKLPELGKHHVNNAYAEFKPEAVVDMILRGFMDHYGISLDPEFEQLKLPVVEVEDVSAEEKPRVLDAQRPKPGISLRGLSNE